MKNLINKFPIVFSLFCLMQMQSQTFDFETIKGGWDAGFQMTSSDLDNTTGRNTLKCIRTGNNATLGLDAATATIDPTDKDYVRLVIKNESNAIQFRVRALTSASGDNSINFTITAGDTEFKTYLFNLDSKTTWNNIATTSEEVEIRFRQAYNVSEGSIFIDEITFYNSSGGDSTPPVITVLSGTDTVEKGGSWTDAGATSDGGETVTTSGSVDTATVGTYTITYSATDASSNTGTATRTVTVVDTTAPIITVLSGTDTIQQGVSWTDAGATSDGGETVTTSGTVDTATIGTYTITYSATDTASNTGTATRTVTVVLDPSLPINRVLPADSYFYTPTINEANQRTLPAANGSSATELQALIDELTALTGGGVLNINAGTYTINSVIDIKSNVHIRVDPSAIFETVTASARSAMFQAGYANTYAVASNWSIQSTNGEKFTFNFSSMLPNDKIRALQLGNTTNFKISDFLILDNFTKFNGISSGAVGDPDVNGDYTQGSAKFPTFGIIENLDIKQAHYGYGLIQCQVGQDILYRNLSGEGGVTLRFESGFEGLANRYLQDDTPTIERVYARDISCIRGAHALMISPHTMTQGIVDARNITGISCEAAVSTMTGFLSLSKGQKDENDVPLNGHTPGTFSEESVVSNVSANFGTKAQVRGSRKKFVPCTLKGYVSTVLNEDEESFESPALAAVLYLALEDYTSFNTPEGRYQIVLDNVSHTGFSSEVRADGLITDNNDDDFNGCATYARNLTVADGNWDNASSWEGTLPSQGELKTIAHNIDVVSDVISDATIEINESKTLTIKAGFSLTLNSDVITNDGLILEAGAQIIINGEASGKTVYKRSLTNTAGNTNGWYSVSPPVSGETLDDTWANANSLATSATRRGLATYAENGDIWDYFETGETSTFVAGKGYIVKTSADIDVSFTGDINTADTGVDVAVTKNSNGFNLLGNPYTSIVNSGTFITNNSANLALQQIWIWDNANTTYDVGVLVDPFMLSPGQAFFVQANATATLNFSESNQATGTDTFQKTTSTNTEITLTVSNEDVERYAKVYYLEGATEGYDAGYEGEVFGGLSESFSIYTQLLQDNEGKKYQIQSLPNSNFETMVVPVGLKVSEDSEITFKLETENIPDGLNVFLEDKQENTFTQLDVLDAEYKVSLTKESNELGRFCIHTKSKSTLNIDEVLAVNNIKVYLKNISTLRIIGLKKGNIKFKLFNILGEEILTQSLESELVKDILLPKLKKGIYIIQLQNEHHQLNRKIVIE